VLTKQAFSSPINFHLYYSGVRVELDRDLTNFTVREGISGPARVCASVVNPLDPVCPIQLLYIAFLSESDSAGMLCI
jgi:hypothetical protein